jgi:uncharacterized membrane protein
MAEKPANETPPGTNRIEAFSDGVFAIVITLLVFQLQTPEINNPTSWSELLFELYRLAPKFSGYVISFFFVAVFWVSHHQFFNTLNFSKRGLLWVNNLFLFFVTFIPFPTAVLGRYHENLTAVILFGLTFFAASLTYAILRWYGWLDNETSDKFDNTSLLSAMRFSFLLPVLYITGIAVAFYNIPIAILIYFLTPILLIKPIQLKTEAPDKEDLEA